MHVGLDDGYGIDIKRVHRAEKQHITVSAVDPQSFVPFGYMIHVREYALQA